MKIAILSDIHGNSVALREVLKEVKSLKIEKLVILGDIVGYYYKAKECLKLLSAFDWSSIQGNHEGMFLEGLEDSSVLDTYKEKYGSSLHIAKQELDDSEIELLRSFKVQMSINHNGNSFLFCHGSPWDRDLYIYKNSDQEIIDKALSFKEDIAFIGHNHYQYELSNNQKKLISTGSVGQNRHTGGIAQWCILDLETKDTELVSTPYDVQSLIEKVKQIDPKHAYLADVLTRKRRNE